MCILPLSVTEGLWRANGLWRDRLKSLLLSLIRHPTSLNEMPMSSLQDSVLLSVVEHVFLPPKLPQHAPSEEEERRTNEALCHILIQAAAAFSEGSKSSQQQSWSHMIKMMEFMYWIAKGPLVETELKDACSNLAAGGGHESPPVYVLIVYVHFQMSLLCMFKLRTPLSSFAS